LRTFHALASGTLHHQRNGPFGQALQRLHRRGADILDDEARTIPVQHGLGGLAAFHGIVAVLVGDDLRIVGLAAGLDAALAVDFGGGLFTDPFGAEAPAGGGAGERDEDAELDGAVRRAGIMRRGENGDGSRKQGTTTDHLLPPGTDAAILRVDPV